MTDLEYHPLANIFPLIEGQAFDEFCEAIRADGRLHDKIVLLGGKILDGRNRHRACDLTGVTAHYRTFNPDTEGSPLTFVLSKNLHRRHLNDAQRASVAAKIANLGRGRPAQATAENPPIGGISADQAAETLNVTPRQVERARVVHEQGVPELREALDRGEIAVSAAEKIARLPEPEQRKHLPNGARAIMGSRQEPDDSLDYFPTPPWATRALFEHVLPHLKVREVRSGWDPACGEGHMVEAARAYVTGPVHASDIHDYGYGEVFDYIANADRVPAGATGVRWIFTNPPFKERTEAFFRRAIVEAGDGVALFVRLQWLETKGRYERIFRDKPPTLIAFFAERVPLCKGEWKPDGDTATAYIWLVWIKGRAPQAPFWIPPDCRDKLSRDSDIEQYTANPVIKAMVKRVGLTVHDTQTGEVIEQADTSEDAEASEQGLARQCQQPATQNQTIDDLDSKLEIPAFLRRQSASVASPRMSHLDDAGRGG